jgi:NADH-quinone oxidoreductase subunit J
VAQNLFYFLSFFGVLCALMVVFSKNPVHSALYLILTFFAIAGHYLLLNAQFLFVTHLIVYSGAIMVLFLYVIMMLNLNYESEPHKSSLLKIAASICGGMLLLVLVAALKGTAELNPPKEAVEGVGMVETLGEVLFRDFLLPFEVCSILLLAAMVGAVMLGKSEKHETFK